MLVQKLITTPSLAIFTRYAISIDSGHSDRNSNFSRYCFHLCIQSKKKLSFSSSFENVSVPWKINKLRIIEREREREKRKWGSTEVEKNIVKWAMNLKWLDFVPSICLFSFKRMRERTNWKISTHFFWSMSNRKTWCKGFNSFDLSTKNSEIRNNVCVQMLQKFDPNTTKWNGTYRNKASG